MREEFGGTGTPFGYTDPDLYRLKLDHTYSLVLDCELGEPTQGAVILLDHWIRTGEDLVDMSDVEVPQ